MEYVTPKTSMKRIMKAKVRYVTPVSMPVIIMKLQTEKTTVEISISIFRLQRSARKI